MALIALCATAQNLQKGNYGYLFCHMNDRGRAWTAYALSRDGLHYHDLLNGDSVFSDHEHARIEGATRDAYILRRHDGSGYLMVCTDMNVAAKERLGKVAEWDNYGITLLRSDDLLHWQSTSFDYRRGPAIFSDPQAESVYKVVLQEEGSSADVVSRSIARDRSWQKFDACIVGAAPCKGHTECDSIIMDEGTILAVPSLEARHVDASLVHEAAIGKIAGEQLIKLMTLGLSAQEAEEEIINGFLA